MSFFPLAQIGPLEQPAYKVYTVTKDNVEEGGGQTLHFGQNPYIVVDPNKPYKIDLDQMAQCKPLVVTLNGYHLDHVTNVQFTSASTPGASPATEASVKSPSVTAATSLHLYLPGAVEG